MSVQGRRPRHRTARGPSRQTRQARLIALVVVVFVVIAALISTLTSGSLPLPPRPGLVAGATPGDPFGYVVARQSEFVSRATAGNAQPLFDKSPGGALATAARVAAYRPMIDRATSGTGIDPNLLEGLVFVESAGRPQVIAGTDPADAAGLTQILAATGQSLLGMNINLQSSRRLTAQIDAVAAGTRRGRLAPLLARRAAIDPRFDPAVELAATVRYLQIAERQFSREDLAFESYHMGIGNLHQVLTDYDGGASVPYAQLYFDTSPQRHALAYKLLSGLGDESSLYLWRLLGAAQIMKLYRSDRGALKRLSSLETAADSTGLVLHPPDRTPSFSDPTALADAYQNRTLVPLPANAAQLGLAYSPSMGSGADRLGGPRSIYRGLRPLGLRTLIALAARVRTLSGGVEPLQVLSSAADAQYVRQTGSGFALSPDGYSFQLSRRYVNGAQADAFQAVLDRLQSLNIIAWAREPAAIDITVSSDARAFVH